MLLVAGATFYRREVGAFRRTVVDASDLGATKSLRAALLRLGLLHALPPLRGGQPSGAGRFGLVGIAEDELPAALLVSPSALRLHGTLVSVLIDRSEMERLESNPQARGRRWESAGWLGVVHDGHLRISTGAGLRIHGGGGRNRKATRGYRLYFRKRYGLREVPGALLGPEFEGLAPRRLVLRNRSGLLGGPLALDLMREAGVPTPQGRAVRFYLNGEDQGVHHLTEYIDQYFLEQHFGHRDFTLVQTKINRRQATDALEMGERAEYERFLDLAKRSPAELARIVDLENLIRWTATILYCGTHDAFQGSLARDSSRADAKWFWIAWDLDTSFQVPKRQRDEPWEVDQTWRYLFAKRAPREPRVRLLRYLLRDETFRRRFASTLLDLMNHRFTVEFREQRFRHYSAEAASLGEDLAPGVTAAREYFRRRDPEMRRQVARHFAVGEPQPLRVRSQSAREFFVDGVSKRGDYLGWYLPGSIVEIAPPGLAARRVTVTEAGAEVSLP